MLLYFSSCHFHSRVLTLVVTCCYRMYLSLSFAVTCCTTRCLSVSLDVSPVCLLWMIRPYSAVIFEILWKKILSLECKLFPLKNNDKEIVRNILSLMSLTKKLFSRLLSRKKVRRLCLSFILIKWILSETCLRIWLYSHLFVHKNGVKYVTFKKPSTATWGKSTD